MNLKETFEAIEDLRFAARLTLASDPLTFLRAAQRESAVHDLRRLSAVDPRQLADRILQLLADRFDTTYGSPHDAAVAVYLWVLASHSDEIARMCAAEVLDQQPQYWYWSSHIARRIHAASPSEIFRR